MALRSAPAAALLALLAVIGPARAEGSLLFDDFQTSVWLMGGTSTSTAFYFHRVPG